MRNNTIGKMSVFKDDKLVELSNSKDIKIEDIIGVYLATTTNDNQTIAEVGCEIARLCERIEEETGFVMPPIKVNDVPMFAYMNSSFVRLKNDKDGFLRVIVTDDVNKIERLLKKCSANLSSNIQGYFINSKPTFEKKNN